MKILIVENDPAQSGIMAKLIGIKIIEPLRGIVEIIIEIVSTMADALSHADTANVTILDLGLPDSDPADTINSISRFRPPVIVMTGYDDPELIASCQANGADHVFVKGQVHGLCSVILGSMIKDVRAA